MIFYCSADGQGPKPPIDWRARWLEIEARGDDPFADTTRADCLSHVVRNGNPPCTFDLAPEEVAAALAAGGSVELGTQLDEHGGASAVLVHPALPLGSSSLLCPECRAPVRAVDAIQP